MGRSFSVFADVDLTGAAPRASSTPWVPASAATPSSSKDSALHYIYNWLGEQEELLTTDQPLPTGRTIRGVNYTIEGRTDGSPHGTATLHIGDDIVQTAQIRTQPAYFTLSGEGATVGREIDQPVSSLYAPPFTFSGGTIHAVTIDVSGDDFTSTEHTLAAAFARD